MDPQRFRKIAEVFEQAWRKPRESRAGFLDSACGDDVDLRSRVQSLLGHYDDSNDPLRTDWIDQAAAADPELARGLRPILAGGAGGSSIATMKLPETHAGRGAPSLHARQEAVGDRIGHFEIAERIGEGGFGTVYRARQTFPVIRDVALKVIKPGMDTREVIARFEAERQALAVMDHPGIAKVFDAGATETGRPYFAMELVAGIPITRYCNEKRLDPRARLELFASVCHAVQHAHQKGIIHRDIKPSNVLVVEQDGRASPRVIDFGIAKATQQRLSDSTLVTLEGQFVGTPAYMSPEQADLRSVDIDTRSDIYALGVLLYELLTGTTPFDPRTLMSGGLEEMLRIIREVEAPPPSSHAAFLRGELDWIVAKCLEKDRARRYQSASELAEDIERHLHHEPVRAGPPSRLYRFRKLVRRNRGLFAAGGAIAALLVLSVVGTSYGLVQAQQQRDEAKRAQQSESEQRSLAEKRREEAEYAQKAESEQRALAEKRREEAESQTARAERHRRVAEATLHFLTSDLLGAVDPERPPAERDERISDVLARAEARLASGAMSDQPEVEAALHDVIGHLDLQLGQYDAAEQHYRRAADLNELAFGDDSLSVLSSYANLAETLHNKGQLEESRKLFQKAIELERARGITDDKDQTGIDFHAQLCNNYAELLRSLGELDAAEALYREALERLTDDAPVVQVVRAKIESNLAELYRLKRDFPAAFEMYDRGLAGLRAVYGDEHASVATVINNKGLCYAMSGDRVTAEPLYREALAMRRRLLPPDHPEIAQSLNNLAANARDRGQMDEAVALYRESLEIAGKTLPPDHFSIAYVRRNMGQCLTRLGQFAEAEEAQVTAYDVLSKSPAVPPEQVKATIAQIVKMYEMWDKKDPTSGAAAKAEEWRKK